MYRTPLERDKPAAYFARARAFAKSGNLPAALQLAEWIKDHEAALAALQQPAAWHIAADVGAAGLIGLAECDGCHRWTAADSVNCEHCGAAVMPF